MTTFNIPVERKTIADLLSHFGPDPVTRGWCVEANTSGERPYVVEVLDESKEAKRGNIKRHRLTDKALRAGLVALVKEYPHHIGRLMDEDRHDAPMADLFVQCCIFGEEKYG